MFCFQTDGHYEALCPQMNQRCDYQINADQMRKWKHHASTIDVDESFHNKSDMKNDSDNEYSFCFSFFTT